MGLNYEIVKFLLYAHAREKVGFSNTLTLGKQEFFLPPRKLASLLRRFNYGAEQADRIIASGTDQMFQLVGADSIEAMDLSAYEGATVIHDLNKPVSLSLHNRYSCVFDGGELHYVFNVPQALESCMRMVASGGHFLAATMANNGCGHRLYQFSPGLFYGMFSPENGIVNT